MTNLKLKIIHTGGHSGSTRLCDTCTFGMIHRGEGMEFAWCGYMREYVSIRVDDCNRYTPAATPNEEFSNRLIAHYTLD